MGGTDETNNIVKLLPEEHYVAHQLLVKMHPETKNLIFALHMITLNPHNNERSNNKMFGWARRRLAEVISITHKNKHVSVETREKLSKAKLGKTFTEEHKANISAGQKGRKHSAETKAKMSAARKGKTHTEEAKAKMSATKRSKQIETII